MRAANFFWVGLLGVLVATAAGADSGGWVTGATLEEQLAVPVTVSWTNAPLRRALASLSTAQHLAIVLDRRIDPDQTIELALSKEPLASGLQKIARHLDVGYCQLGPIAYFGPTEMARRLRTLAALRLEEIRPLPTAESRKFLQLRSWHWDELAQPRQLLDVLADEAAVKIVGAEKIPHDLWPAADLPPLTWVDRLSLLAAQFELTFRVSPDGRQVELVPAPANVTLSRTYRAGRDAKAVAKRWAKAVPGARVVVEGNTIRLTGLLEDHELVEHQLRATPTQRTTVTAGKEVYQLSVENSALTSVVEQLAERLRLELQWDRPAIDAAGISVDQLITVKVKDASLDELLRAVLAGTGLTFRRLDRAVSIYPAESNNSRPTKPGSAKSAR